MKQLTMKSQALPPGVYFRPNHVFEPCNPPGSGIQAGSAVCGLWQKMARYSVIADKYKYRYTGGYQGNGEVQVGYR